MGEQEEMLFWKFQYQVLGAYYFCTGGCCRSSKD